MILSKDQVNEILDDLMKRMEADEGIVSVGVENGDDDSEAVVVFGHLEPEAFEYEEQYVFSSAAGEEIRLPTSVEQAEPIRLELARPDEPSFLDTVPDQSSIMGMSGTKIGYSGGGWGTLCLSGAKISATFRGKTCSVEGGFVCTNAHVADAVGKQLSTSRRVYGRVNCVFDLDAPLAFDLGTAKWTANPKPTNFFTVYQSRGGAKKIEGLREAKANALISKQGAKTGWTTGRAARKVRIRVEGHSGIYPAWRGTYRSAAGDSGSPVLQQSAGKWYLVGIHFASGPHFQSWDDADVKASPQER